MLLLGLIRSQVVCHSQMELLGIALNFCLGCIIFLNQSQADVASNEMPSRSESVSLTPDKFIQELRKGNPPILSFPPDQKRNEPLESTVAIMDGLKDLGMGYIRFPLKVIGRRPISYLNY